MFRSRPESLALLKPASPTLRLITVPSFAAPVEQEGQHRITLSSRAFTIELDVLLDGKQLSRDEMGGSGVGQALKSWFDEEGEIMGIERVRLLCDNAGLRCTFAHRVDDDLTRICSVLLLVNSTTRTSTSAFPLKSSYCLVPIACVHLLCGILAGLACLDTPFANSEQSDPLHSRFSHLPGP